MEFSEKEEKRIRLFTILIIVTLVVFTIFAALIGNQEFMYYDSILLPLILVVYLIHKKIRLHFILYASICLMFIMHAAGGVLYFGGTRLYDMFFWIIKYDNIVHFLGSLVVTFVAYNLIYNYISEKNKKSDWYLFIILVFMAAGFGTIIELVEFVGVLFFNAAKGVGDYFNNTLDLLVNLLGALLGSVIILIFHREEEFKKRIIGKKR